MTPSEFLAAGIAVIPVLPGTKKPAVRWFGYQHTLPTKAEVDIWFRPGRHISAAVVCGWRGLTVVDFDTIPGYHEWLAWAIAEGGEARVVALGSYKVKTARGVHVYLFVKDTPRCGKFRYGDIKARGGYVLIPPSVHPSGAVYTAVDENAPIMEVESLQGIIPDPPAPPVPTLQPTTLVYPSSSLWPATVIEEIKQKVSILEFFPDAKETGAHWYMAVCPFHQDENPSLWIDTKNGICGCYAGCLTKPADVIELYCRLHNVTAKQAVRELRERL
jgi:hypothetical protein